jgi:hypothetical protein
MRTTAARTVSFCVLHKEMDELLDSFSEKVVAPLQEFL